MSTREERLAYERRILAAEVETVRLAKRVKRFAELIRRNTQTLDAALCLANARAERERYDRLVVEPWMPMLLSLLEDVTEILPEESDNQNRLLSEKQPKSVVSSEVAERLSYYEREVPGLPDAAPVTIKMGDLRELLALAAGTRSAETSETSAPSEGCQSGPNEDSGDAQKIPPSPPNTGEE